MLTYDNTVRKVPENYNGNESQVQQPVAEGLAEANYNVNEWMEEGINTPKLEIEDLGAIMLETKDFSTVTLEAGNIGDAVQEAGKVCNAALEMEDTDNVGQEMGNKNVQILEKTGYNVILKKPNPEEINHNALSYQRKQELMDKEREERIKTNFGRYCTLKPEEFTMEVILNPELYEALVSPCINGILRENLSDRIVDSLQGKDKKLLLDRFKIRKKQALKEAKEAEKAAQKAAQEAMEAAKQAEESNCKAVREAGQIKKQAKINMTKFSNLPSTATGNKAISWDYWADDSGIYKMTMTKDGFRKDLMSKNPMLINCVAYTPDPDDNICIEGEALLELLYKKGNIWFKKLVPSEYLLDNSKIKALGKYLATIDPGYSADLVRYFQSMLDESTYAKLMPYLITLNKLGWVQGCKKFYFGDEREVLNVSMDRPQSNIIKALKPKGNPDEWFRTTKEIRATNVMMFNFCMAAAIASPIVYMLGGRDGYCLNIYGQSGTGKSTAMEMAGYLWGDMNELKMSLQNSVAGLETRLNFLSHIPGLFDDFNNTSTKEKEEISNFVMKICNGKGRQLATRAHGIRQEDRWCNFCQITSEENIVARFTNNGSINRVFSYKAPNSIPWTKDEMGRWKDSLSENYGWGSRFLIEVLIRIGPKKIHDWWKETYDDFLLKAKEAGKEVMARQVDAAALLSVADRIGAKYIFKDGRIIQPEVFIEALWDAREVDQNATFYNYIMDFYYQNSAYFEYSRNADSQSLQRNYYGIFIGKELDANDQNYVCFLPEVLKKMARERGIDCDLFCDWLKSKGLLDAEKGGRYTKHMSSKIKPNRPRMIKISMALTEEEEKMIEAAEKAPSGEIDPALKDMKLPFSTEADLLSKEEPPANEIPALQEAEQMEIRLDDEFDEIEFR